MTDPTIEQMSSENSAYVKRLAEMESAVEQLTDENIALKKRLADIEAAAAQQTEDEALIAKKMNLGLTRQQAIAVIRRQRDFDTAKVAASKKPH